MNNKNNVLIVFAVIAVLIIGCYFLFYFISDGNNKFEIEQSEVIENEYGYNLVEEEKDYSNYLINLEDMSKVLLTINKTIIQVIDNKLTINNKNSFTIDSFNRKVAFYGKYFLFTYNIDDLDYLVFYNTDNDRYDEYYKINDLFIRGVDFSKGGITADLTIVDNKKIYIGDEWKDICKTKIDNKFVVESKVENYFDPNTKEFTEWSMVFFTDYSSYLVNNSLCY